MTEREWSDLRGLRLLWDRGKKRWVYPLDPTALSWKEELSAKCAAQNQAGDFKHSHIRGYFKSEKCQAEIYYGSSYELRCMFLLENNPQVKFYRRGDVFIDSTNGSRNPDLHVEYVDGIVEILEVKPERRFAKESAVQQQIQETQIYADQKGYRFSVWSEKDSGLRNDRAIINWAKMFIAETTGNTEWIERQKENDRKKAIRHYYKVIAQDKVTVWCDYCGENHEALRLTHDKNLARNGRYICEREGGHIAGSKPKPHLVKENPFAAQGMKQCNQCDRVLTFDCFGKDNGKRDGFASICKECRSQNSLKRYYKKKKEEEG
jgi:hypothetical protein